MGSLTTLLMAAGVIAGPGHPEAAADEACPASFRDFLSRFAEDAAFQRRFTADSLVEVRGEAATAQETTRPKDQVAFPVMPGRVEQLARGLAVTIRRPAHGQALVRIESAESNSYAVEYSFVDEGGWTLIRRRDFSTGRHAS